MMSMSRRAAASISAVALVVLYALITFVPRVAAADRSAFAGRLDSGSGLIVMERLALSTITIVTLSVGLLVVCWRTYRRQGHGAAVHIAAAVVGAVVSAELLKHFLPTAAGTLPFGQIVAGGSFPSGHATIATGFALAVASTLDPKPARRCWGPLVAWVSLVAAGTVAAGWHRPSDAVGGVLLAVIWHTALVRRRVADEADGAAVGRSRMGVPPAASISGWGWWAVMGAAVMAGALAPQARSGPELGEAASPLYVVGLAAVLAATGALLLLGPSRGPALRPESSGSARVSIDSVLQPRIGTQGRLRSDERQ